jgi:predicted phage replisome organizer
MKIKPHWMKLDTNIFSNVKINRLRKMPEGDSVFTLWIWMLCEGMKNITNPGVLEITNGIPMKDTDIADSTNIKLDTVQMAITAFNELGMIVPDENGSIEIPEFRENQSIDRIEYKREQTRIRVQKHRENSKKLQIEDKNDVTRYGVTCNDRVDKSRVEENRIKKKKSASKEATSSKEHKHLVELYFSLYEDRFKTKPMFDNVEGNALKNLLKKLNAAEIEKNLRMYMSSDDEFYAKNGYTLRYFQTAIKGLRIQKEPKKKPKGLGFGSDPH